MRCLKCRDDAVLEVRRHNAAFCSACYVGFFHDQVARAIKEEKMFSPDDRVLVAISGGKDSLALWDALMQLGYGPTGLYIDLGISDYSGRSREKAQAFANSRGARLLVVELAADYSLGVLETARLTRRAPCSACGLSKRYIFNKAARDHEFSVVATGHNLDDEAATLLGNTLRWQTGYLARQGPALPEGPGLVRKVKPLYRLAERETAAYAVIRGIDYILEECPMAKGAKSLLYKEVLNRLEETSPGTKQAFLQGFLEKGRPLFKDTDRAELQECLSCGQPTTGDLCAFCRLGQEVRRKREKMESRALVGSAL